ncbi:zinc ribbon domain-containing protein [Loigolactobacillus iwatensis]|uniref:zinc ribbon domain-containing protein n=1 Tax=Loigolactobacillus iwatensis TaxID=1267156 RepID=UPI000F7E4C92|nr:zinc ribbon domain-containing protein [Loigolactobacillus iwatensis]
MVFKKFQNVNEIKRLINRQNSLQKRALTLLQKGEPNKGALLQQLNKNIGQRRRMTQEMINVMLDIFKTEKITSVPAGSFYLFSRTTLNPHDRETNELLLQLNKQDTYVVTLTAGKSDQLFASPRRAWLFTLAGDHISLRLPTQNDADALHLELPDSGKSTKDSSNSKKQVAKKPAPQKQISKKAITKKPSSQAPKQPNQRKQVQHSTKPHVSSTSSESQIPSSAVARSQSFATNSASSVAQSSATPAPVASAARLITTPIATSTAPNSPAKSDDIAAQPAKKATISTSRDPKELITELVGAGQAYRVIGLDYGKINMITATDGMDHLLQVPGSVISNHILEYQHAIRQLQLGSIDLDDDVELARLTYMLKRYVLKSCRKIVSRLVEFYGNNVIYVTEMHPSLKTGRPQNIILSPDYFYKALFTVLFEMVGDQAAVIQVPNNETSIICPWCGFTNADNRQKEVHQFKCLNCGHTINDDQVAAINIRQRGLRQISELTKHLSVTPTKINVSEN